MTCPQCGTEVAGTRLSCPVCHALIHAAELKTLALAAETAAASGDVSAEISSWRQALPLLPAGSRQLEQISAKVADLSRRLDSAPAPPPTADPPEAKRRWKGGGVLATLGLLAWKLKTLLLVVLTKGKLLLLGLTNAGTVLSMALSFGVYWAVFGWPFAAGLILSLYVHEMGHVAALRRLGIPAQPAHVPARDRRRGPPPAASGEPERGRPDRSGGPALGDGRRDRRLPRLSRRRLAAARRHRALGSVGEPLQPPPRLAARRRPRLPRPLTAAKDRRGRRHGRPLARGRARGC